MYKANVLEMYEFNIKEIDDLSLRYSKKLREELDKQQIWLRNRKNPDVLYRCFELSAAIELYGTNWITVDYDRNATTYNAFRYLEEAAKCGYTKAVKVYIVMTLARGGRLENRKPDIILLPSEKQKERLEKAIGWFSEDAKKEKDVQEVIELAKKEIRHVDEMRIEAQIREENQEKLNKKAKRIMRIISLIMIIIMGIVFWYVGKQGISS